MYWYSGGRPKRYFRAVMPNGEQLRFEAWVIREWRSFRHAEVVAPGTVTFFDPEIQRDLERAEAIY